MLTRPMQPIGVDAHPTGALAFGIAVALGIVFAGVLVLPRGRR